MPELVKRPKAPKEKATTSENFEFCYLRHQYLRRAKYNPTPEEMQPYMSIVEHFSRNTFFTYYNLFKTIGMYQDDIANIGRVHLVSFLGLYALEQMKDKKKDFSEKFEKYNFKEAEEKDFIQKNKANFTLFFKQRMEDLVRVCRQKLRNVKGQSTDEYVVFSGKIAPPRNIKKLLKEYKELGYNKIEFSVFKAIRKRIDVNNDATMFHFDGLWYVAIALEQRSLTLDDLVGSEVNPYESVHHLQPDDFLEEKELERHFILFNKKSDHKKEMVLRKFIAKNKNKVQYKEEIATARKLLRSLGD